MPEPGEVVPKPGEASCQYCNGLFGSKGITAHEKACKRSKNQLEVSQRFTANRRRQEDVDQLPGRAPPTRAPNPTQHPEEPLDNFDPFYTFAPLVAEPEPDPQPDPPDPGPEPEPDPHDIPNRTGQPKLGDIKRVFHPHSGLPEKVQSLEEYTTSQMRQECRLPNSPEPWKPFKSRLDFEVAEFCQDVMLNSGQINTLISLIRRCASDLGDFTLHNHRDLDRQWERASKKCTQFEKTEIQVPYKHELYPFEMYARPLWDWTLQLVQDPRLSDVIVWDAEKAYFYNGEKYVRFFTEPWTANAVWAVQSKLPASKDAKACFYILYADKAKLSSFGTQKGYPIIARLGNIFIGLRNSTEWGGGQIVGWLPVIDDEKTSSEGGKQGYVNFKNAVWHAAFYKLVESVEAHSFTGYWTKCGDGVLRQLFPVILILACDFEEACVMALTRGTRALHPCPICLVNNEDQSDLTIPFQTRTSQETQEIIRKARLLKKAADREQLLKANGLRDVDIAYSDPHKTISWDKLHAYGGLWDDHLFVQAKKHAERHVGRAAAEIDKQYDLLPRWRNLNHFSSVMSTSFNDGTKHEDIAKMMTFAAHNVLTDKLDLKLLQCIRSFQELLMHVSRELHTSDTIEEGRKELQRFGRLIDEYSDACIGTELGKSFDVPKMHGQLHIFDDIRNKGITKNFGTKIDESMHGFARAAYLRQTNFKNVAQILKSVHRSTVCKYIRDQLDDLDTLFEDVDDSEDKDDPPRDLEHLSNVVVGAKRPALTFEALEQEFMDDPAFRNFRVRFGEYLSDFLQNYDIGLPNGRRIRYSRVDQIVPYQFLKVFFKSLDNWVGNVDYLRCNPSFHNRPRFDGALVKTVAGDIFVQLIYVFAISVNNEKQCFALVQPLDAPRGALSAKDKALGFYRVRAKPRQASEFIPVRSIIRGALLASDSSRPGDFLVIDLVDVDMWLRLKQMYPGRNRQ
ncbi:hypothetical protein B0H13DRAFT_1988027 [Mycena leptocephala]|nr:hypothetical protein B0H13DRAFT_1988027 [Mycena leptocephala]